MVAPNIFKPRNDWNIISFRCSKYTYNTSVENLIAKEVMNETGINPLNYRHCRGRQIAEARQLFFVMMVKYTKRTYKYIGSILGKDHATINHSIKTVSNLYETDKRYKLMYDRIEEKIKKLNLINYANN